MYDVRKGSIVIGAFGPISIAADPAPPVHLAGPLAYTAISHATTMPYRPSQAELSIQATVLKSAYTPPYHAFIVVIPSIE